MLTFNYSGMALFYDNKHAKTELRVVLVRANDFEDAIKEVDRIMEEYAIDFGLTVSGINVYEYGSDVFEEYREVFSLTWNSIEEFDSQLEAVIVGGETD